MKQNNYWNLILVWTCSACVVAEEAKEDGNRETSSRERHSDASVASAATDAELIDAGGTGPTSVALDVEAETTPVELFDSSTDTFADGEGGTPDGSSINVSALDASTSPNVVFNDAALPGSADVTDAGETTDAGSNALSRFPTLTSFQERECPAGYYCGAVQASGFPAIDRTGATIVTTFSPETLGDYSEGFLRFYDVQTGELYRTELMFTEDEDALAKLGAPLPASPASPEQLEERLRSLRDLLEDGGYRSLLTSGETKRATYYDEIDLTFRVYECEPGTCPTSDQVASGDVPRLLYSIPFDFSTVEGSLGPYDCHPFGVFRGPIEGGIEPTRRLHAFFAPIQYEDLCTIEKPFLIWHY
jgi:hypothetical protein